MQMWRAFNLAKIWIILAGTTLRDHSFDQVRQSWGGGTIPSVVHGLDELE
ncbi:MAG: hypothetical protein QOJ41_3087, partial [Acidobacteriaceae bacterium]|nr:hypothetical protein [Acidobacteriaceae bacterium]